MFEKNPSEQELLREVGIHRVTYQGTWLYESSGDPPKGTVTLAIYYEVYGDGLRSILNHWRDISCDRPAIELLLSSMKLKEELHLPYVRHGRYCFLNALNPNAFSTKQDLANALAASSVKWTLALWDEDKQAVYLIKYRH